MLRNPVTLLLLVLAVTLITGAAPADVLWLSAVEAARLAKGWAPGEMRLSIEMADDRGKVLEIWENRYRLSAGADGTVRTEVVSAIHNGKDETPKEREAQGKREANTREEGQPQGSSFGFGDDPFDPDVQESLEIRLLAGTRAIAGRTCILYAFTLSKPKGTSVEGTAWLDPATGIPVEVVSSPRPLPRGAHELVTTLRYGTDGLVSEVLVEGSGSLLFFKRRFSSVVTFGSYYRRAAGG